MESSKEILATSEVVVIGGGVIGLSCAYELVRKGVDVTVLDKGRPGEDAAWGSAGWVTQMLSAPLPAPGLVGTSLKWMLKKDSPLYIKPWADSGLPKWLWDFWRHCNRRDHEAGLEAMAALTEHTMTLYDELAKDGIEFEMEKAGLLFAFTSEEGLQHTLDELRAMERYGYSSPTVLDGDSVRDAEPALTKAVVGGMLVESERHLRPELLTAGLFRRLAESHAKLRSETEVTGVKRQGSRMTCVVTTGGEVPGDRFLIAGGAWSASLARMAGFHLPVQAGKGYSVTVTEPAVRLRRPLYLGEAKLGATPFRNALRIAGTMELTGINEALDPRRIDAIRASADQFLVGWRQGKSEEEWAGMRPVTPDGLPAIGRAPGYDNLYVATGHAVLGVTLAPATGVAMAELIHSGKTDVDLRPFDPNRFS